ncbi:MAG: hypothetical protein KGI51_08585 [Rhodospirillales bacterium]|nr:hypothetical protein [Rhodospirillales bacterium]
MSPRRPPSPRRAVHALVLLPLLAALAGCGPGRDEFAPSCPLARPLAAAHRLERYRHPAAGAPDVADPADLEASGLVLGVDGKCRPVAGGSALEATMRVRMQLERGPAATSDNLDVPYFIAVAQGSRILTKQVFSTHVAFPSGNNRVQMTSAPIAIRLPLAAKTTGADYTIWVGFQLTEAEYRAAQAH